MLKVISTTISAMLNWKLEGDIPPGIEKCLMIVAPHTSNIDYFFGLAASYKLRLPIYYLIKEEWLKRFFIGKLMRSTGAIGVDRSERKSRVESMAGLFKEHDRIALTFPPEGTRKLVQKWKTGFYYVAMKAEVPIVFVSLDYKKKKVIVGPSFMPTGNFEADMNIVREHYRDVTAKYPEKFSLPVYDSSPDTT